MGRKRETDIPTLPQAWAELARRHGWQMTSDGDHAIRVEGQARGRPLMVQIGRDAARSEGWRFLAGLNTVSSRNRRDSWHTVLAVGCVNPSGRTGAISSAVDLNDPAWTPGAYDPRSGRAVRSDPPDLAARVLDASTHERLMSIIADLTVQVGPTAIVIEDTATSRPDTGSGYVAGSFLHHYQGSPPPWPERAVAGPPWWIELLCDLADAVDRADGVAR